jgi:hypothetical protein
MGTIVVVVVDELAQDRAPVTLADGYHVIQAFAAGGPHRLCALCFREW